VNYFVEANEEVIFLVKQLVREVEKYLHCPAMVGGLSY
jgi:hypothetical protein